MKIEIKKQIIESILINTQPFLDKKDATQITSHIYFNVEKDICIIKATDLEIGIKIITKDIEVYELGSFTVNGKKLLDIIRILKDEDIILELDEQILIIKQNRSKFKLPTFESSQFPKFPTIEDKGQITLDSLNLIRNLKKITPSIDNNNPKYELNGALIDIKEGVTNIVGTDTKRLAVASIYNNNDKELSIIIPKKAIVEIEKIFLEKIDIFYDQKELIIQNNKYFIFTKLLNGKFPDYNKIIPKEIKYNIKFPKKEMLEAIKQISIISQDITINFTTNAVYFSSLMQNSNNVEARTQLEINLNIEEDIELNFNSKYLIDFLSQIDSNEFIIGINSKKLPFVVKDKDFITIIMPITN